MALFLLVKSSIGMVYNERMRLKLVLVDDEVVQHRWMQKLATNQPQVRELLFFQSPKTLLFELADLQDVDAFLLDVEMPEMDGLILAHQLRQRGVDLPIVFMTAYAEFALASYDVQAFDYLLKPITQEKFDGLIQRLLQIQPILEPTIFFNQEGLQRFYQKDLYGLEAQGHFTRIILKNAEFLVRESISKIRERLNEDFIQTHRSYVVNLQHIKQINQDHIILDNEEIIPLSRRQIKAVSAAFVAYYQKRDFRL